MAMETEILLRLSSPESVDAVFGKLEKVFTLNRIFPLISPERSYLLGMSFLQVLFLLFEGFSALGTGNRHTGSDGGHVPGDSGTAATARHVADDRLLFPTDLLQSVPGSERGGCGRHPIGGGPGAAM